MLIIKDIKQATSNNIPLSSGKKYVNGKPALPRFILNKIKIRNILHKKYLLNRTIKKQKNLL